MMSIDQVKRLEQPMLVRLIDEGQLILETDLQGSAESPLL